eukprot:GEMP01010765.1.p1 GENE.GEMP01010765.1~~GEMP01010765.1.p1  ORF type:complete len:714 (+),score=138.84 GEMP01010765.1:138-2279(+)
MSYQGYNPDSPSSARLSPNSRRSGTSKPRYREPSKSSQPTNSVHDGGGHGKERRPRGDPTDRSVASSSRPSPDSRRNGTHSRRVDKNRDDASTLESHGDEFSLSPIVEGRRVSPSSGRDEYRGPPSGSRHHASDTHSRQDDYYPASPSRSSRKRASSFDSSRGEHQPAPSIRSSQQRSSSLHSRRGDYPDSPSHYSLQRPSKVESKRTSNIRNIAQTRDDEESSYGADQKEAPRGNSSRVRSDRHDMGTRSSRRPPSEQYAESESYAGSSRTDGNYAPGGSYAESVRSGSRDQESGTYSRGGESRPYSTRIASAAGSILQGLGGGSQRKAESQRQYDSYEEDDSEGAPGTVTGTIREEDEDYEDVGDSEEGGEYEEDGDYEDCASAPSYRDGGESVSHYTDEELNEEMEMRYAGLFEAVEEGDATETGRRLQDDKQIDLNTVNPKDETCLMLASRLGHVEVVRVLLKRGAKFEFKATPESPTPLVLAAKHDHLEVVQELLNFGAYPDQTDEFAHTPLFYACANGNDDIVRVLIHSGANVNAFARVKDTQLVEEMNNIESAFNWPYGEQEQSWDATGEGKTPLHLAARFGYEAIMILLTQRGAYVDAQDDRGRTAVWWAAAKGRVECLRRLVRSYAHLDTPDGEGNTPLMWAVRLSQIEAVGVLLDFGANVNYHNPKAPKKAPLEWAIRYSNEKMVHALRADGAVPDQPACAIM